MQTALCKKKKNAAENSGCKIMIFKLVMDKIYMY